MKLLRLTTVVGAALLAGSIHAQAVITDGDFTSWSFGSYQTGTDTATVVREPAGGNPGSRLNVTTLTSGVGDVAFGTAIKNDFSTNVGLAGTGFSLTLEVLSGAGAFGQGQAIWLLVEQSETVYAFALGITGFPRDWDPVVFNGAFEAASFFRISGAGPASPVFDGSVATRFGFAAGNSNSATLTQYYDNFRLELAAVPALAPILGITKTVSTSEAELGEVFTYTITVNNAGNQNATGVTVTDDLPDRVTLLSATPSQGTCSGTSSVTCSLGTLAASASATVTLSVRATATGDADNVAIVDSNEASPLSTPPGGASVTITSTSVPIPTASEYALMTLAVLLAAAGVLAIRLR